MCKISKVQYKAKRLFMNGHVYFDRKILLLKSHKPQIDSSELVKSGKYNTFTQVTEVTIKTHDPANKICKKLYLL